MKNNKSKKDEGIGTPIKVKGLVNAYGRKEAGMIIERQVRQTIIMKQRSMRGARPVFNVLLKDPIAGKLIIDTDHALKLQFIDKNGRRRDWFVESEIHAMVRRMPAFDQYYEVRRVGFDNE